MSVENPQPFPPSVKINQRHAQETGLDDTLEDGSVLKPDAKGFRTITPEVAASQIAFLLEEKQYTKLAAFFDAFVQQFGQITAKGAIEGLNAESSLIAYDTTKSGTSANLDLTAEKERRDTLVHMLLEQLTNAYTALHFLSKIRESVKLVRKELKDSTDSDAERVIEVLNTLSELLERSNTAVPQKRRGSKGSLAKQLEALYAFFEERQQEYPEEYRQIVATIGAFRKELGLPEYLENNPSAPLPADAPLSPDQE